MKKWTKAATVLIFVGALTSVLIWQMPSASSGSVIDITVDKAVELIDQNINNNDFAILDLRTPRELKSGVIKDAQFLDFLAPRFKERLATLDKEKTYLILCARGHRSDRAKMIMKEAGFNKIFNMADGMDEWYRRSLPTSKPG